jgi:iron complex transport system substrate-binding protein
MPGLGRRAGLPPLLALLLALAATPAAADPAGAAAGPRVMSLNLCTDQLALQLLPRARIVSVSDLAADPAYSVVAEQAEGLPVNHARAEEVLARDPDIVLAGKYAHDRRGTLGLLRRLGYRVVEVGPPRDLADVRRQIRRVAEAVGAHARGAALIDRLNARLAAARRQAAGPEITAAIYQPNGITVGPGDLPDAVLQAAGLTNLAARLGLRGLVPLPLERLVMAEPDVLVLQTRRRMGPSLATRLLRHPALAGLRRQATVVRVPAPLWSCPGPQIADAITRLAAARREAR